MDNPNFDDKYQCHICMELAHKPVVTPCGHLFCWVCIYHWLRSNQQYLTCPICKSGLQMSSLRPLIDPNDPIDKAQNGIPPRPRPHIKKNNGIRFKSLPKSIRNIGMNVQRGVLLAGYGLFPSTYMSLYQHFTKPKLPQLEQRNPFKDYIEYKMHKVLWIFFYLMLVLFICYVIFF